jgi:hypothetical protein
VGAHSRRSATVSLSHSALNCRRASAGSAAALMRPLCARMKAAKPSFRGVPDSAVSCARLLLLLSRDLRIANRSLVTAAARSLSGWLRRASRIIGPARSTTSKDRVAGRCVWGCGQGSWAHVRPLRPEQGGAGVLDGVSRSLIPPFSHAPLALSTGAWSRSPGLRCSACDRPTPASRLMPRESSSPPLSRFGGPRRSCLVVNRSRCGRGGSDQAATGLSASFDWVTGCSAAVSCLCDCDTVSSKQGSVHCVIADCVRPCVTGRGQSEARAF